MLEVQISQSVVHDSCHAGSPIICVNNLSICHCSLCRIFQHNDEGFLLFWTGINDVHADSYLLR